MEDIQWRIQNFRGGRERQDTILFNFPENNCMKSRKLWSLGDSSPRSATDLDAWVLQVRIFFQPIQEILD